MTKLLFLLFLLFFVSCKEEDKNIGTILFFNVQDMTTVEPLSCEDIIVKNGLYKLPLNEKLYKELELLLTQEKDTIAYYPDVRYRVDLPNSGSICFDYSGNYVTDNNKGKSSILLNKLINYIANNREDAILVNKALEEPWKK